MTKEKENKKQYIESEKNKLDQCVSAPHPEMTRSIDSDEPCNDNRG